MAQNLLDTHTLIWYINGDSELSQIARAAIEADNAINFVSIASLWEIAIKISLSKLELKTPINQIGRQMAENGFEVLPIIFEDTLTVSTLSFHHRDPFDRIIIVQSFKNRLTLISRDTQFGPDGIRTSATVETSETLLLFNNFIPDFCQICLGICYNYYKDINYI